MQLVADPGLSLLIYSAETGTPSEERMLLLASVAATATATATTTTVRSIISLKE